MQKDEQKGINEWTSFDKILEVLFFLAGVILLFLMISVCWDVLSRKIAGRPLKWVLEFSEYGLLYMAFLCTARALRDNRHVASDLFLVRLSPKMVSLFNTVTSIAGSAICLILTFCSAYVAFDKLRLGSYQPTTMEPPDFPLFIIMPVGFCLLFIQFLRKTRNNYRRWKTLFLKGCLIE